MRIARNTLLLLLAPLAILAVTSENAPVAAHPPASPLKRFVGTFDVHTKLYMQPGQPPMETKAVAVFKEIMRGRFVRQDYKDAQMGVEGVGYFGFEARTKTFSSVWIYNMSAKIEHSTGKVDDKGVLKLTGEGRAYEHSWTDADTRLMKSWAVRGEKRTLLYEITYKRKK